VRCNWIGVGTGAYVPAVFTSVVALVILVLLAPVSRRLAERARLRAEASKGNHKAARPLGGEESEERHWEEENV